MFQYFRKNEIGELVVIVLDGEYSAEYELESHIILGCPMKVSTDDVKRRISGATSIPTDRIMLLFCGQVLSNNKAQVPLEAFELPDATDEDTSSYRPRLCMSITEALNCEVIDDDDYDNRNRTAQVELVGEQTLKAKHKRKHKDKGEFNLETELGSINCSAFTSILQNSGYDNEVNFMIMFLAVLAFSIIISSYHTI